MKLIEKKCPNCGGKLTFSINDKEATCNYCNASYVIDRDAEDIIADIIQPEAIIKHFNRVQKVSGVVMYVVAAVFIVAIITFMFIMFRFPFFGR